MIRTLARNYRAARAGVRSAQEEAERVQPLRIAWAAAADPQGAEAAQLKRNAERYIRAATKLRRKKARIACEKHKQAYRREIRAEIAQLNRSLRAAKKPRQRRKFELRIKDAQRRLRRI